MILLLVICVFDKLLSCKILETMFFAIYNCFSYDLCVLSFLNDISKILITNNNIIKIDSTIHYLRIK